MTEPSPATEPPVTEPPVGPPNGLRGHVGWTSTSGKDGRAPAARFLSLRFTDWRPTRTVQAAQSWTCTSSIMPQSGRGKSPLVYLTGGAGISLATYEGFLGSVSAAWWQRQLNPSSSWKQRGNLLSSFVPTPMA